MTNTVNTPFEVTEKVYPIMILEYSLRDDSGGAERFRGEIRRIYKILDDAVLCLTAERVKLFPWGLNGGLNRKPGELSGKDVISLSKEDIIVINTPGGGGYGNPEERDHKPVLDQLNPH